MKPKESIMKFVEAGIEGLEIVTGGGGKRCHRRRSLSVSINVSLSLGARRLLH